MTTDKALDLALAALEGVVKNCWRDIPSWRLDELKERITAIKQARSAPVQEPADGTQVSKVWWDGEKLMAKPIPLEDLYRPAPVQEPVACHICGGQGFIEFDASHKREKNNGKWGRCLNCQPYTTPPAQPAPVPLTPAEVHGMAEAHGIDGDARHWYVVGITDSEKHHSITKGQP